MNPLPRPQIAATFAMTADGKIATRCYSPSQFTSKRDKMHLLEKRALADAVMVGRGTLETDTMTMGLPEKRLRSQRLKRGQTEYPLRVIVSSSGKVDPALRIFQHDFSPIILLTSPKSASNAIKMLGEKAIVIAPGKCNSDQVDLPAALHLLYAHYAVHSVACEGGPTLFRALLDLDLMDRLHLTLVATVFGGTDAPTLTGGSGPFFHTPIPFRLTRWKTVLNECFADYERQQSAAGN